jgi:monoterpene epsilon-lactone hydrolase
MTNTPQSVTQHAITPADQAAIDAMRLATAPMKGKINSPAARLPFEDIMRHTPAAPGVTYEAGQVGGVAGWWCRPEAGAPATSAVLFLHGGGYVLGTADAHRNFVSQLVARVGVDFFVPDYRLAPEHPFPAAIDDALAAYRGLVALGKHAIALAGDSAGGGLALVTAAVATGEAAAQPAAVPPRAALVFSPWTDLSLASASFQTRAEADPIFTKDALGSLAHLYLHGHDARDVRVSPVYGNLTGLPPVQVHVGEAEVLLDDSVRYVALAQEAGVAAELHEWEGLPHVFAANIDGFQAATHALDLGGAFLAEQLA